MDYEFLLNELERLSDLIKDLSEQLDEAQEQYEEVSSKIARIETAQLEHEYWQSQF